MFRYPEQAGSTGTLLTFARTIVVLAALGALLSIAMVVVLGVEIVRGDVTESNAAWAVSVVPSTLLLYAALQLERLARNSGR